MTAPRVGWVRGSLFLLLSVGAGGLGCQNRLPPATPPAPAAGPRAASSTPFSASFSARNWSFHLRRLAKDGAEDEVRAAEVWRELFAGIAGDAKTRELLRTLHGGRPVKLVILDAKQAEDDSALMAPPPDGCDFVLRLADLGKGGEPGGELVRLVAYSHVALIRDKEPPAVSELSEAAKAYEKVPLPGEPLSLALEDYVLRHAPGWAVIGGPYFRHENPPKSADEQRRDLEWRVREYAAHAEAFYGAPRSRH